MEVVGIWTKTLGVATPDFNTHMIINTYSDRATKDDKIYVH